MQGTAVTDEGLIKRLTSVWDSDRRPGTITVGGANYTVSIIDDEPVFVHQGSGESLYADTSTSALVRDPAKTSAKGTKTKGGRRSRGSG